jgi:hypothetical protein
MNKIGEEFPGKLASRRTNFNYNRFRRGLAFCGSGLGSNDFSAFDTDTIIPLGAGWRDVAILKIHLDA